VTRTLDAIKRWMQLPSREPQTAEQMSHVADARLDALMLDIDTAWVLFMNLLADAEISKLAATDLQSEVIAIRAFPATQAPFDQQTRQWQLAGLGSHVRALVSAASGMKESL